MQRDQKQGFDAARLAELNQLMGQVIVLGRLWSAALHGDFFAYTVLLETPIAMQCHDSCLKCKLSCVITSVCEWPSMAWSVMFVVKSTFDSIGDVSIFAWQLCRPQAQL